MINHKIIRFFLNFSYYRLVTGSFKLPQNMFEYMF